MKKAKRKSEAEKIIDRQFKDKDAYLKGYLKHRKGHFIKIKKDDPNILKNELC